MTPIFYFWDGRALCFGWTERCCRNPLKNNNTAGGRSLPLVLRTRGPALLGAGGPLTYFHSRGHYDDRYMAGLREQSMHTPNYPPLTSIAFQDTGQHMVIRE